MQRAQLQKEVNKGPLNNSLSSTSITQAEWIDIQSVEKTQVCILLFIFLLSKLQGEPSMQWRDLILINIYCTWNIHDICVYSQT